MNIENILLLRYKKEWEKGLIEIADEGDGVYIKRWEVEAVEKPSLETILKWVEEYQPALELYIRQEEVRKTRRQLYPSVGDQLDMIYKDMKNDTTSWVSMIDKIKADNPKPTQ